MTRKRHSKLWIYFAGIIFTTVATVSVFIMLLWYALYALGFISLAPLELHMPVMFLLLGSTMLGCAIALFVGRLIIRPIQNISDAFDELSQGNFSVKVSTDEKINEIREMAQRFNAMTYDLSHIETPRTDFVANVSHEFKTPIAAIEGYATLLQNPNLSRKQHDLYVDKILNNSRRLSNLSSNILVLSKLENQGLVVDNCLFRLDEQIRKAILLLEGKWSPKNLEFDMDLPKEMYFGSEALLAQVWSNVLDNAIKHSPEGGIIHVNTLRTGKKIMVSIRDHGEGMTEEVQKHIFEKFYQGDSSHKSEGNGLGLALVKRIVELSHGEVTVKSAPGEGSTFNIILPVTEYSVKKT